jgi:hypothetical protein
VFTPDTTDSCPLGLEEGVYSVRTGRPVTSSTSSSSTSISRSSRSSGSGPLSGPRTGQVCRNGFPRDGRDQEEEEEEGGGNDSDDSGVFSDLAAPAAMRRVSRKRRKTEK